MVIDLTEWYLYTADDVFPGPIPAGVEIETMQIVTANCIKKASKDGYPKGLGLINDEDLPVVRLYWRLKK